MQPEQFEELLNFRDFGGYPAGHATVVRGRLFRSAAPDVATPADLGRLAALGIEVIVDLRRWSERQAAPSRRWPEFAGSVVETIEQDIVLAPHERYLGGDDLSRAVVRDRIIAFYREAPFEPRHRDLFRRGIAAVAEANGAAHVHCAVGKDRTGILVSLIHHVLGVSAADQMHDYLLTLNDRRLADRLNGRAIAVAAAAGKTLTLDAAEALTGVDPDYLETCWASIRAQSGSLDAYLSEIGLTEEQLAKMRERLVI